MRPRSIRILSIDGGGIRGVIPAMVLHEIERRTDKRIAESFDLIAGTSTGAVLTMLLTCPGRGGRPKLSAEEIVEVYIKHGRNFFSRTRQYQKLSKDGMTRSKYPAKGVVSVLEHYLDHPRRITIAEAVTNVLVTAWDIGRRQPVFFMKRSWQHRTANFYMTDVAHGSTAFPGIFPAAKISSVDGKKTYHLLDGGLFGANPSVYALAEAMALHGRGGYYTLVSLGTGDCQTPIQFQTVKDWGLQAWARPLAGVMFDATSNAAHDAVREILPISGRGRYYRLQIPVRAPNDALDNTTPANIRALEALARKMIRKEAPALKQICRLLV